MKETDLYQPVKELLQSRGFKVKSEVCSVDVVGVKEEQLVIVELKTSFTLRLVLQAIKRQEVTDYVYVAIPRPKYKKRFGKDFEDKKLLLYRLGLGLLFVSFDAKKSYAQVVLEPNLNGKVRAKKVKKRSEKLITEFKARKTVDNIGGTKGKVITAYLESAVLIAYLLVKNGPMSTQQLKNQGTGDKTTNILNKNVYGWYERVSRGIYQITEKGKKELDEYAFLIQYLI